MKSAVYMDGKKFIENEFKKEEDFEDIVKKNSQILFGSNTIYFDLKNKIDTKQLGRAIPDGFLFDFRDKENPEFYLIEVELAEHDFWDHIFPQITKFFAFFKNKKDDLVNKLFQFVTSNPEIEKEFKNYLGRKEIYKAIKDITENSQNILIVIDEDKPEFHEVMETYIDTWDKLVKIEILKQYTSEKGTIFTLNPDFEEVGFVEPVYKGEIENKYTEGYHTEGIDPKIINVYNRIKQSILQIDSGIRVNPQKYYISLRKNRNFAFIEIRKKKMHIVIMLPFKNGSQLIKFHDISEPSQSIQDFYNGPCFYVTLENDENLDEVIKALEEAYKKQK